MISKRFGSSKSPRTSAGSIYRRIISTLYSMILPCPDRQAKGLWGWPGRIPRLGGSTPSIGSASRSLPSESGGNFHYSRRVRAPLAMGGRMNRPPDRGWTDSHRGLQITTQLVPFDLRQRIYPEHITHPPLPIVDHAKAQKRARFFGLHLFKPGREPGSQAQTANHIGEIRSLLDRSRREFQRGFWRCDFQHGRRRKARKYK